MDVMQIPDLFEIRLMRFYSARRGAGGMAAVLFFPRNSPASHSGALHGDDPTGVGVRVSTSRADIATQVAPVHVWPEVFAGDSPAGFPLDVGAVFGGNLPCSGRPLGDQHGADSERTSQGGRQSTRLFEVVGELHRPQFSVTRNVDQ